MNEDAYSQNVALRRLVVWLAAREVAKAADPGSALAALSDDQRSLQDEVAFPPGHPFQASLGRLSAAIDGLVQEIAFTVRCGGLRRGFSCQRLEAGF